MKAQHTPGPWEIEPHDLADKDFRVGPAIIDYDDVDHQQADANAFLIAAAPDLLDALKEITNAMSYIAGNDRSIHEMMRASRAAIAKATGQRNP
jgi:hypothetical protein